MSGSAAVTGNRVGISDAGEFEGGVSFGGGVYVVNADFVMEGGEVSYNAGVYMGGGVGVFAKNRDASFTMKGGVIKGNFSNCYGGSLYLYAYTSRNVSFVMEGGVIFGYNDVDDGVTIPVPESGAGWKNAYDTVFSSPSSGLLQNLGGLGSKGIDYDHDGSGVVELKWGASGTTQSCGKGWPLSGGFPALGFSNNGMAGGGIRENGTPGGYIGSSNLGKTLWAIPAGAD
ncbi:MAG: hypothetical protein LBR16_02740 [Treponema sp.]|jgi:hypothetical protein|nr:hypothetical protein [Treponema sp.]